MNSRTNHSSAVTATQPILTQPRNTGETPSIAAAAPFAERNATTDRSDNQPAPGNRVFADQTSTSDSTATFPAAAPDHVTAERSTRTDAADKADSPAAAVPQWIGTTRAKRLLEVGSENTIKNWVRYGYLRARRLPNGRIQVLRSDVIRLSAQPVSAWSPAAPDHTADTARW